MQPSLILDNAAVVDVERGTSRLGSVAIEGDTIRALGSPAQIAPLKDRAGEVLDLTGKTLVPGFNDAHSHLVETGVFQAETGLREVESIADIQDLVRRWAGEQPAGTLLRGWGLQENLLRELRLPTKDELDTVAPDHYVQLIRDDGHASVVNSKLLDCLGFTAETPGADAEGGEPTGVLRARAQGTASKKVAVLEDPAMREQALDVAAREALRVGLTTVQVLEGSDETTGDEYAELVDRMAALPIHTVPWWQTTDLAKIESAGLPRVGGCITLDGAPGSYTGALFEPYSDRPDTNGLLYFDDDELNEFVLDAHRRGCQIALHATCQRAIEQGLQAYESALDAHPKDDHRLRLEHVYGLTTPDQFERMGRRGIVCSTQPAFLHYRMAMYHARFGERWRGIHPHRLALEHGATIAGGSDSPVTPLGPLLGIHCAVNHPAEEQRVDAAEALRWFTCNAAYAAFEEGAKGTITPGKLADLAVLGRNILTEDAAAIKDIPVLMTIVAGQVKYRAD